LYEHPCQLKLETPHPQPLSHSGERGARESGSPSPMKQKLPHLLVSPMEPKAPASFGLGYRLDNPARCNGAIGGGNVGRNIVLFTTVSGKSCY